MNGRLFRSATDRVFTGLCGGIAEYFDIDPALVRILAVVLDIFTGIFPLLIVYVIAAMIVPEEPPVGAPGWGSWGPTWGNPNGGGPEGGPATAPGDQGSASAQGAQAGTTGTPGTPGAEGPAWGPSPAGSEGPAWGAPPPGGDWRSQRDYWRQQRRAQRAQWRAQRWGSEPTNVGLVFGVLLVVVGGAFLVRNLVPSIDTDIIWPAVLVVLGAVLLAGALTRR